MRSRALCRALLLVLVGACGPRTQTGDGDGDGSAGGTTSAGETDGPTTTTDPGATSMVDSTATGGVEALPEGCSCREPAEFPITCDDVAHSECDGETLCPDVLGVCARPSPDMYACASELAYDEDAVACALAALRDRSPGKLAFDIENDTCGFEGCGSDRTELTIVPDDRVVVRRCAASPLSAESSSSSVDALAEPTYFDECLALASARERYECMVAGITRGAAVCE